MKISSDLNETIKAIRDVLKIEESFDIIERTLKFGGKTTYMYYIDGFIKDDIMQFLMTRFFNITEKEMDLLDSPKKFMEHSIPYVEVAEENDVMNLVNQVLSGQTAMLVDGFDKAIMLDLRTYPARGPQEPDKEKSLRGPKDGFVETIVFNTALIRRRVRDSRLVFKMFSVGKISKTDVAIGYMNGIENKKALDFIVKKLNDLDIEALTMGDQSLVETIAHTTWYNPFPKVRYTERPDVAAAHITEGKIIILVDNSPTAMLLPTSLFDFLQDVDDYYLPVITGNFLRFIRNFILFTTLFLTPLYMLIVEKGNILPDALKFLLPQKTYPVPLLIQFLILEIAIDGLKLASLNTPGSLGMSLSVIGALILGEFAINTGWLIPQSIFYMAIVSLGSFSQPSVELGYAIKFLRILILILTSLFSTYGFFAGIILSLILIATNKTFTGEPYLYPLIPFNWKALKSLIFRIRIVPKQRQK